jgi:hypothetical protein
MSESGKVLTVFGAVAIIAAFAGIVWVAGLVPTVRQPPPVAAVGAKPAAESPGDLARPVDLYALTLNEARLVAGHRVEAFLEVGCPVDVADGFTVVAAYERPDGVERHVYLVGDRHHIGAGDRLTAEGVLRVVEHAAATVNGVTVPPWVEIRIENAKAKAIR